MLSSPCSARDLTRCTCWIAQKGRAQRRILSLPPTAPILAVCARYFAAGVLVCGGEDSKFHVEKDLGCSDSPAHYPLEGSILGDSHFKSGSRTTQNTAHARKIKTASPHNFEVNPSFECVYCQTDRCWWQKSERSIRELRKTETRHTVFWFSTQVLKLPLLIADSFFIGVERAHI